MKLKVKSRIARIAAIVINVVSISRKILNRIISSDESQTYSVLSSELALLSWLD